MIPLSLPEPSHIRPRLFTGLAIALCVFGLAHIMERLTSWSGDPAWQGQDLPERPVTVSVGEMQFQLMPDFIASAHQRRLSRDPGALFQILRLAMTWPDLGIALDGRPEETLQIELESSHGRESLRARLDPFYRRLARGGEISGPDGLKVLRLSASGAAATDQVVYDPDQPNGFIARCRTQAGSSTATCHRAIVFSSGLELRYSFSQDLLADWRRIDAGVVAKIREFQQP